MSGSARGRWPSSGYAHYRLNQIDLTGTSGIAAFFLAQKRLVDIALQHPNADPDRLGVDGAFGRRLADDLPQLARSPGEARDVRGRILQLCHSDTISGDGSRRFRANARGSGRYADYTHLSAMVAPNPLQIANNARDNCCFRADYAQAPLMVAVRPIWEMYGDSARLRSHVNFDAGHNYGLENREALYRFLAEFFHAGSAEEIPSAAEVRKPDELRVPLPAGNESFHSIAVKLAASLPKPGGDRARLRDIVRWTDYHATPHRVATQTAGAVTITTTRLALDDTWTVPAIEFSRADSAGTTLVIADSGRSALANEIDGLLQQKQRVVAIDPFYFGESRMDTRDFLFALLVSSLGERPLGIQAGQVAAAARWLKQKYGSVSVTAYGPRTSLIAQVAAAADPDAIAGLKLVRPMTSLHEVLERDLTVQDAPELFCFGLLEYFDIPQLTKLHP